MPRNDEDYIYDEEDLRQVGPNAYASPFGSRGWGRAIFGLPREPVVLASEEEVNVTAPRPKLSEPYPEDMAAIYLGTKTSPPTGTYTPPLGQPPRVEPSAQPGWNKLLEQYPYAEHLVENVVTRKLDPEVGGQFSGNTIYLNEPETKYEPGITAATLAHEAAHAAQFNQFPKDDPRNWENYMGANRQGPWNAVPSIPYGERHGEDLAAIVGNQAYDDYYSWQSKKRRRENQGR